MCVGCLLSAKEKEEQIEKVSKDAKKYADDNKKLAILYYLSDTQIAFMDADRARASGITPIKFVSWL